MYMKMSRVECTKIVKKIGTHKNRKLGKMLLYIIIRANDSR